MADSGRSQASSPGKTRYLKSWFSMLATARGRAALAWYVDNGIAETVAATATTPEITWSQDGEDLYLAECLPNDGFFVDVGAHHPDRFSVTRKLSDAGWTGVNVDVSPDFVRLFAARRPRDTNVRSLVGQPGERQFWHFTEPALSTLDEERARRLQDEGWAVSSIESMQVRTLTEILAPLSIPAVIDLLSVDVEGADLEVLQSLDWDHWHVRRALVELSTPANRVEDHPVAVFLIERGLAVTRVWGRSCLFEETA